MLEEVCAVANPAAVANNIERKYFFMIGFVSEGKDSARRVQRKMKSLRIFNFPLPSRYRIL